MFGSNNSGSMDSSFGFAPRGRGRGGKGQNSRRDRRSFDELGNQTAPADGLGGRSGSGRGNRRSDSFGRRSLRGGGNGGRSGSRRMFGPGDLRLMLLALIEEKHRHGYELIKELEQKFGGEYAPSPGSVYPTLMLMEELGHIRSIASEGNKRLFEIAPDGTRYLRDNEAALRSVKARMEMAARAASGDAPPSDLRHAMHVLRASLQFHRGGWGEKETERVRRIIEAAADAIARRPDTE